MLRLLPMLSMLGILVACSSPFTAPPPSSPSPIPLPTPTVNLIYTAQATSEIIYADLQAYTGAPRPGEECLYTVAPVLRIFGDGRTGLDLRYTQSTPPWQWEGQLTAQQLQTLLGSVTGRS
nr:unknown Function [uncultured bacterium]